MATTYTIANDIIPAVRKVLDYNEEEDALGVVSEVDTLALDTIITSQAQNGLRWCLMNCPKEWVTWSKATDGTSTGKTKSADGTHYYYQQDLPDGYVRFGSAMLGNWKVPCYSVVGPDDKEYVKQFGEFEGLMATPMRPVTALLNTTTSSGENAYLQLFPALSDTTLTYCNIAVLPNMSSGWSMKSQLLQPLICVVAAFTAEVLKDSAKANILMSQAQTLLTTAEDSKQSAIMQAALAQKE